MDQFNCIRIVSPPIGPSVPQWVREAWIGLTLPVLRFDHHSGGFVIDTVLALEVLRPHNPAAAEWWDDNLGFLGWRSTAAMVFNDGCCEKVLAIPGVCQTSEKNRSNWTIGYFWQRFIAETPLSFSGVWWETLTPEWREARALLFNRVFILWLSLRIAAIYGQELDRCCDNNDDVGYNKLLLEGHTCFEVLHRLASQSGIHLELEEVDQPLSMVDEMVRKGLATMKGGLVMLTEKGKRMAVEDGRPLA